MFIESSVSYLNYLMITSIPLSLTHMLKSPCSRSNECKSRSKSVVWAPMAGLRAKKAIKSTESATILHSGQSIASWTSGTSGYSSTVPVIFAYIIVMFSFMLCIFQAKGRSVLYGVLFSHFIHFITPTRP